MIVPNEEINASLRIHQQSVSVEDWEYAQLAKQLHVWAERFVCEFKLAIVSLAAIRIESLHSGCYGHFVIGRNSFGILNEIGINRKYLKAGILKWRNLGTLLHELLHFEQKNLSANNNNVHNHHDKDFRNRAKEFGLIVDRYGHTKFVPPPSQFWEVLKKYGVEYTPDSSHSDAEILLTHDVPLHGDSKLKLWICTCQPNPVRVRVAISDFEALCLKCNQKFVRSNKKKDNLCV